MIHFSQNVNTLLIERSKVLNEVIIWPPWRFCCRPFPWPVLVVFFIRPESFVPKLCLLFSIPIPFLYVAFLPFYITFCFHHNLLHASGWLLRQWFVEMADLQSILESSYEHFLIWMGEFYGIFIEPCHIFSEGPWWTLNELVVVTFLCLLVEKYCTIFLFRY